MISILPRVCPRKTLLHKRLKQQTIIIIISKVSSIKLSTSGDANFPLRYSQMQIADVQNAYTYVYIIFQTFLILQHFSKQHFSVWFYYYIFKTNLCYVFSYFFSRLLFCIIIFFKHSHLFSLQFCVWWCQFLFGCECSVYH